MTEEQRTSLELLLNDVHGRRVMLWVLELAGIYRDAFTNEVGSRDYILGQQSIGRRVISAMDTIDPRHYPSMLLATADETAMARAAAKLEVNEDEVEA